MKHSWKKTKQHNTDECINCKMFRITTYRKVNTRTRTVVVYENTTGEKFYVAPDCTHPSQQDLFSNIIITDESVQ